MGGPSDSQQKQDQYAQSQAALAQQQQQQSQQIYSMTEPGLQTAESYFQALASGDPAAIQRAISPATEQIASQYNQAKQNIVQNVPRGGVQQLALAQAEQGKAAQMGTLAQQAYTSAAPALANLAGQGIGLSVNQIANAISAYNGAGQIEGNIANQDAQGKGATMGLLGSMSQSGAQIASAAMLAAA